MASVQGWSRHPEEAGHQATPPSMKILYVCNDHPYFDAHRLWLAEEARRRGMAVLVAAGNARPAGGALSTVDISLEVERHRLNLKRDVRLGLDIARAAQGAKPDVVHLITIKPILIGALAMLFVRRPARIVATFPGLGRVFDKSERSLKARIRRGLVIAGLKLGLAPRRVLAIFETEADRQTLLRHGVIAEDRAHHIAGAGVDLSIYRPAPLPPGPCRLLFAGRLLKAKGVMAVVEAARLCAARGKPVEFVIAGQSQPGDPDALTPDEMEALASCPQLSFLGSVPSHDMPALLASVHAVVLPTSYQEGVPRILIEAGAVGRPAIVSDNAGCRAFVNDGETGFVLTTASGSEIADAASRIARDPDLLARMAALAQKRVMAGGFDQEKVAERTLALYRA